MTCLQDVYGNWVLETYFVPKPTQQPRSSTDTMWSWPTASASSSQIPNTLNLPSLGRTKIPRATGKAAPLGTRQPENLPHLQVVLPYPRPTICIHLHATRIPALRTRLHINAHAWDKSQNMQEQTPSRKSLGYSSFTVALPVICYECYLSRLHLFCMLMSVRAFM